MNWNKPPAVKLNPIYSPAVKLNPIYSPAPTRLDAISGWLGSAASVFGGIVGGIVCATTILSSQTDDGADGPGSTALGMMIFAPIVVGCVAVSAFLGYAIVSLIIAAYRSRQDLKTYPHTLKIFPSEVNFHTDDISTDWDMPPEIKMNSV